MSDLRPLALLAALNLAAAISPGPAFVLITKTAASARRPVALATAAGTVLASVIWATSALLGWQLVLSRAASVYRLLQFAGGLYLAFIGWSTWRHAPDPLPEVSDGGGFRRGLLLGLSNPKVIIFFSTIFTTLFTPGTPRYVKWAAPLVVLVDESLWYGTLATLFGTAAIQRQYRRVKTGVERVFGSLFVLFGLRLAWTSARSAP
jgi:threonine/homoserine/homoserine lactone efflux protein